MNLISSYRRKAGITQAELGKRLGWAQTRIGNYETGYRQAGIEDARRIALVLSDAIGGPVSIDDLFPPEDQEQAA
jgi:putative transcriptional regulator